MGSAARGHGIEAILTPRDQRHAIAPGGEQFRE
jgi:hypothetical protein